MPDRNTNMPSRFSLTSRARSFRFAFQGIGAMLQGEPNAVIHLVATVAVIIAGIVLQITRIDWLAVTFAIVAVWTAEAFNTAIESLADAVTTEPNPQIKRAEDIAAAAVLICAIGSLVVAAFVFIPAVMLMFA